MWATLAEALAFYQRPPLLVDSREAARLLGVSERTLWTLKDSGQVRAINIGRSVRYPVSELERYIRRQLDAQAPPAELRRTGPVRGGATG
jgi:excisionase family DNA binding protein